MKKILTVLTVLTAILALCGCQPVEEETKTLDYAQMDKEFSDYHSKNDNSEKDTEGTEGTENTEGTGGTGAFDADMPQIEEAVKEYAYCLVSGDAKRYAQTFPNDYIIAIMNAEGCTWDMAIDISTNKIWETFSKIEKKYSEIRVLNPEHGHQITVKNVKKYSKGSTLMGIYAGFGVELSDVVEITFEISSFDKKANGSMRLVKTAKGLWEPDMSYFGI